MVCKKCKAQISDGANFCTSCGAPVEKEDAKATPAAPTATATATPAPTTEKNNVCALIGFILSIVSVCCCGSSSIIALILSIIGLNQIKKGNGQGKGLAIAGIILSIVGTLIAIALGIFSALRQIDASNLY